MYMRTAKYGSKKITGTDLVAVEGNVIEILEDAVFTTINEAGITTPITSHNVSGVQSAGERIFAHTKFTGVQLASGSVRVGGFRRRKKVGLSGTIKNALAIWLFGGVPRDSYVTDKHGQQDRELLDGEIFPGRAYEGDGTNYVQYAEISNELEVNNGDLSLSIWTRATSVSAYHGLAGKGVAGVREGSYEILWNTSGNQVRALINTSGGSRSIYGTSGKDDGEWHHYILQIDNTSKEVKLYEDGVHVGSTLDITGETMDIMGPAWEFTIGARNAVGGSGVSSIWNGPSIRDVRVIKRLLTADDIALLYAQKAVGDEAVWYPCEDTDLSTAFDVSGNGYHATKVSFDAGNHVEGNWQSLMNKYGYNQNVTYDEVPPDMSSGVIPTLDCLGNDLVYAGQAQYHGISVDAACFHGDAAAYASTSAADKNISKTHSIYFEVSSITNAASSMFVSSGVKEDSSLYYYHTNRYLIYFSGGVNVAWLVTGILDDGEFHRVLVTRNDTALNLYIDDVLVESEKTLSSNEDFLFDRLFQATSWSFTGCAWNIKVFSAVKTWNEAVSEHGDIVEYPLCEGVGTKVYDVSGNAYHLDGVGVDETNWGTQDDFHYIRDHGMSRKIMDPGKGTFDSGIESWTACGTNKIENDNGALKITYQDNANGAETYLRETDDINTDLTVGVSYRLMIKAKINSGSANFYITGPNQASDAITNTDYEWIEIDFVATHTNVSKLLTINLSAGEIIWIDEWYLEMIDRFIPALADKSADALGGVIQYPQNGPNAIPDTYFHLPENIAELTAADLEDRYMDIMDDGKGVFTEITDNSVANGDFDTDTDWTKGTGWTISGGKAVATASNNYLYQTVLTIGKWYKITFTVSDYSAGIVRVLCGAPSSGISRNSDGTYTQVLQCSGNNIFYFDAISSFTGKVDNVSVVEQNVEGWAAYDSNILANDNGSLRIEYVDSGSGANLFLKEANDINKDLVIGNQYIFHYRAKDNGDGNQHLRISDGIAVQDGDLLTTSFQWYEIPFQAESTDGCFVYCDNNANGIIWIDDCFLTEQQTSVGNNLVINGAKWIDSDDDGEPDDWTETNPTQSTSSIVTGNGFVGNALRHEWDTADATSAAYLETNVSILSGTTIQLTFKQRNLNGLRIYFDGDSLELATNISSDETGDAVAHSVLFTASADKTTMKVYIGTSNSHVTGDYYEIDEVEVRPVIDSFFYEPLVLGGDPVIINTSDLPPSRYLVQYYNETNRKDLILLAAGHDLGPDDHKKLLKFTKND